MAGERLTHLTAGMPIPYGGDRVAHVSDALAEDFCAGDRLIVVQETGELLHVTAEVHALAAAAVGEAAGAFAKMAKISDEAITAFFDDFARRLESNDSWAPIAEANAADVES